MKTCKNCPKFFSCFVNSDDSFSEEKYNCNYTQENCMLDFEDEELIFIKTWEEMSYRKYRDTILDYNYDEYNNGSWNNME
jgi:hypothetical protein